jgi:hypothetical protein
LHPNGQIPAYEWALGDVNPPVHGSGNTFCTSLTPCGPDSGTTSSSGTRGLMPLLAVQTLEPEAIAHLPAFTWRPQWFVRNRPDLPGGVACMEIPGAGLGASRQTGWTALVAALLQQAANASR